MSAIFLFGAAILRCMEIGKKDGHYSVESSTPGRFYEVDLKKNTCTCPHFIHRLRRTGGDCKHIKAVKALVSSGDASDFDEIISFVKENVFIDSVELIERFGEDKINELVGNGELIEEHGKIRLL